MPRYYYPYKSRDTVEQTRSFDVFFLKRHGYLRSGSARSGSVVWSRDGKETGRIDIAVDMISGPSIVLSYKTRSRGEKDWKSMKYSFPLESLPCYFGGERWYFICGLYNKGKYCGRRVAKLYGVGDYFGCRLCADLSYDSCNKNKAYRSGHFRILSQEWNADEYYEKNVKREWYNGRPTKKYLKYLRMRSDFTSRDVELAMQRMSIDLGNQKV